jgi:hypothetical protein
MHGARATNAISHVLRDACEQNLVWVQCGVE